MKLKLSYVMLAGALALSANSFAAGGGTSPKPKHKPAVPKKFIDPANMNMSVKPGDDFFDYANGNWIKQNAIPAKETRWGSFNILAQNNTEKLLKLLAEVGSIKGQPKGSLKQRVGDLYASGMDSLTIQQKGYTPVKPDLARIDQIKDLNGIINEI